MIEEIKEKFKKYKSQLEQLKNLIQKETKNIIMLKNNSYQKSKNIEDKLTLHDNKISPIYIKLDCNIKNIDDFK